MNHQAQAWRSLRALSLLLVLSLGVAAFAQQQATLGGRIEALGDLPETARVGIHIIDGEGSTLAEIASVRPVAGTFSLSTTVPQASEMQAFSTGQVLLPGLQNEYQVTPADVQFVRAIAKVYDDSNNNGRFDNPELDPVYLGVASVEDPVGFFVMLYVDQAATLTGRGQTLEMAAGWNVFTVRFPEEGTALYGMDAGARDALLDIFTQ
ncbi:MAG: hypothetical protein AAF708_07075 [Deinococcota bacterium]